MVDNDLESLAGLEDSNDDDLDSLEGVIVYLPDKIMFTGLVLVKYKRRRIKRAGGGGRKRNLERFIGHFRSTPAVIAQVWEDLQTT
jgi:hypothetical protein